MDKEKVMKQLLELIEEVPKLDDHSTFSDTFEFWNITGRNAGIRDCVRIIDEMD
jgi:hypothetical protein